MRGAARVLDPTVHGGPLTTGASAVLVNGKPAVRIGDHHGCSKHGPGPVVTGAPQVLIGGRPMAREGDLCLCAGAGSGTSEKTGGLGDTSGAEVDWDKLEARAKGEDKAWGDEWKSNDGKATGKIDVLGGSVDGGIGPGGISGKGEMFGVDAEGQYGDDANNVGIQVKLGSAEAEGESWIGEHDGKRGFSHKGKSAADGVTAKVRSKSTSQVGDYAIEEETEVEAAFLGADGEPPIGVWGHVDAEKGELCIGGYGETPEIFGIEFEILKQYKFRWKPSGGGGGVGSGGPPNAIAEGSADVLVG